MHTLLLKRHIDDRMAEYARCCGAQTFRENREKTIHMTHFPSDFINAVKVKKGKGRQFV